MNADAMLCGQQSAPQKAKPPAKEDGWGKIASGVMELDTRHRNEAAQALNTVGSLRTDAIKSRSLIERLRDALAMASRQFRRYEQLHLKKGTNEGIAKADVNRDMAINCETALIAANAYPAGK